MAHHCRPNVDFFSSLKVLPDKGFSEFLGLNDFSSFSAFEGILNNALRKICFCTGDGFFACE
jgi:hypothetical protein